MKNQSALPFLAITFIFFLLTPMMSLSGQGGYEIEENQVTIKVTEDGTLEVKEELNVYFSERRRGIFRSIPTQYNVNGKSHKIKITDLEAHGDPYKVIRNNSSVTLRMGSENTFLTGAKRYELSYTVKNAISQYEDHDEFFWNILNFDTDASNKLAIFSVSFPHEWSEKITEFKAFSGPKGNTENNVVLHKEESKIIGAHRTELPPNHGITLVVNLPKGLIVNKAQSSSNNGQTNSYSSNDTQAKWYFSFWNLFPIGIAGLFLLFWQKIEKAGFRNKDITDQYFPPDDLSPAEVGTFYDHSVNRRDIISLLPYWGNKGLITVKPLDSEEGDMYFTKKADLGTDVPEYEQKFFNDLFEENDVVLLSDLKMKFYSTMSKTSKLLKKEVYDLALYDEDSRRMFHSGWLIAGGIALVLSGILLLVTAQSISAGIGLILLGIFIFVFHFKRPKLSEKGSQNLLLLKGLYKFLKNPNAEKLSELESNNPGYLHMIYPYVLAFDLDKSWTEAQKSFDTYTPPIWYDFGPHHNNHHRAFAYEDLSKTFNVRNIEKVFYSAPASTSSSSGGGFSGGSAGGGFGGGSTGSW